MKLLLACDACGQGQLQLHRAGSRQICIACLDAENATECACCGAEAWRVDGEAKFAIHRDGFCDGPQVPLCEACGSKETPTCEEIWERIAKRRAN